MGVQQFRNIWVKVFTRAGFSEGEAIIEFNEWTSGLDGEWSNEWNQTEFSVQIAAQDSVSEIRQD